DRHLAPHHGRVESGVAAAHELQVHAGWRHHPGHAAGARSALVRPGRPDRCRLHLDPRPPQVTGQGGSHTVHRSPRRRPLMLTRAENELLIRTGPGTPMGEVMRRYWLPALLA